MILPIPKSTWRKTIALQQTCQQCEQANAPREYVLQDPELEQTQSQSWKLGKGVAAQIHLCFSETSKCLRGWGLYFLHSLSPMLSFLTAVFATLSSVFRPRSALQLENLALRHQIGVLQRVGRKRPKLMPRDRLLWVRLSRIWSGWRSAR
jgi:hypothetical protein